MTVIRFSLLLLLASTVAGCASVGGGSVPGEAKVNIGNISNLPQLALPGASMQEARSVAMAAARTRGWDIVAADANQLVLERPLPPQLPQAQALGSPLAPPRMQVETNIVERGDGSIVALRAFVLTNPGTPEEKRLDYTSEYENQLLISLSSLSSAWIAARDKLRAEVPVLAEEAGGGDVEAGADLGNVAETVSADGEATAAAEETAASPTAAAASAPTVSISGPRGSSTQPVTPQPALTQPRTAQPRAAQPRAAQPRAAQPRAAQPRPAQPTAAQPSAAGAPATVGGALVAPTIEAPRSPTTAAEAAAPAPWTTPAPVAPTAPADTGAGNDMLALNQGSRKGLWAYYAEDFARLRGCALGDRGAMLLQETNGFEIHEVQCVGSSNLLVKCRGGVCEPMR